MSPINGINLLTCFHVAPDSNLYRDAYPNWGLHCFPKSLSSRILTVPSHKPLPPVPRPFRLI
jgi:hypothetical protein